MKQHIEPDDLKQLNEIGKNKLRNWWKPVDGDWYCWKNTKNQKRYYVELNCKYCDRGEFDKEIINLNKMLPLLSIGQMIEFLDNNRSFPNGLFSKWMLLTGQYRALNTIGSGGGYSFICGHPGDKLANGKIGDEICDILWSKCVELLNRSETQSV